MESTEVFLPTESADCWRLARRRSESKELKSEQLLISTENWKEKKKLCVWTRSVSGTDHPTSPQKLHSQSSQMLEPEGGVWRRPTLRPPVEARPQTEEEELHHAVCPLYTQTQPHSLLHRDGPRAEPVVGGFSGGRWVGVRTGFMGRLHPRSRSGQTDGQVFNPLTGLLAGGSTCTVGSRRRAGSLFRPAVLLPPPPSHHDDGLGSNRGGRLAQLQRQ